MVAHAVACPRRTVFNLCVIGISGFVGFIVAEALASVVLYSKVAYPLLPRATAARLQQVYAHSIRSIVQYESTCTRFDPELFYTLRPGECRFRNPEFETTLRINSMGFRDNEDALKSPDVIVLGDSYAMGWGVEGTDTFAYLVGQRMGLKVLNTGISSYGTVRERIAMSRVPLDNVKYLVVQYCRNDKRENLFFYLRNNVYASRSKDQLDYALGWYRANRKYYPGRSLDVLTSHRIFGRIFGRDPLSQFFIDNWTEQDREAKKDKPVLTEAELFLNALVNAGPPLPPSLKAIIVFSLPSKSEADQEMIEELQAMMARHQTDRIPVKLIVLKASNLIKREDYYWMDDHMRRSGHVAVADAVVSHLSALESR